MLGRGAGPPREIYTDYSHHHSARGEDTCRARPARGRAGTRGQVFWGIPFHILFD